MKVVVGGVVVAEVQCWVCVGMVLGPLGGSVVLTCVGEVVVVFAVSATVVVGACYCGGAMSEKSLGWYSSRGGLGSPGSGGSSGRAGS